jgi:hypothetical protein
LAAEAGASRIRRLLQKCKRNRLHLPAVMCDSRARPKVRGALLQGHTARS